MKKNTISDILMVAAIALAIGGFAAICGLFALKIAGGKHDLVAIRVVDPREQELPDVGIVELRDAETGEKSWIDTSSRAVREYFRVETEKRSAEMESLLKHNRIDTASILTNEDYVVELIKLFKKR